MALPTAYDEEAVNALVSFMEEKKTTCDGLITDCNKIVAEELSKAWEDEYYLRYQSKVDNCARNLMNNMDELIEYINAIKNQQADYEVAGSILDQNSSY